MAASLFKCPVCDEALDRLENRYACANGHSFDIAREGYVNLLLANQRKSKQPGDSKAMVRGRRAFLEAGHYDALLKSLQKHLGELIANPASVLDVGCGEGHFSGQFSTSQTQVYGIDISKHAVKLAAKRYHDVQFAVASVVNLPILDHSIDVLLKIFAPHDEGEFVRVLKPGGYLVTVTPGTHHLYGLRQHVYDDPALHTEKNHPPEMAAFELRDEFSLRYDVVLDNANIQNLLVMTPYIWHIDAEKRQQIESLEHLETPVHFDLKIYQNLSYR